MSTPRIIAGKAKGVRLQDVPGDVTRPITDIVKGALFNILGTDIIDSTFLDLFGGTGSVGIEALSRGAEFVRFTDNNHGAVKTIRANLQRTRLENQAEVLLQDAFTLLHRTPDRQFHYIFIAPPQYKGLWLRALEELDANPGWLAADGWVIVQIDPIESETREYESFRLIEERKYGNTLLLFYESAR